MKLTFIETYKNISKNQFLQALNTRIKNFNSFRQVVFEFCLKNYQHWNWLWKNKNEFNIKSSNIYICITPNFFNEYLPIGILK